ncbi:MAG: polyphosphate kinase 2 family protein [Dysgonamonadaceae bacterium]|jgi:PPK2 family polyphosphate:nucleotide phosphotransferase|nr:polyphosphate kinase 2 family protein [Dysgonamonadaceae bacterium]
MDFNYNKLKIKNGQKVNLHDFSTNESYGVDKKEAKEEIQRNIEKLAKLQEKFYADNRYSLLIILQARDAAGKDGVIRHVMSGINPQGCNIDSFKAPSKKELEHDFLWRHYKVLPERGMIEIFNRSHYENVLVTKVNPQLIINERIPSYNTIEKIDTDFWEKRYRSINNFERHLHENGVRILKFFLNVSKDEQRKRLLSRIDDPDKNWKFSSDDLTARAQWHEYQKAYEEMLEKTSHDYAPWYVIPADKKYFARVAIGDIILDLFKSLDLHYPPAESPELLEKAREILENE